MKTLQHIGMALVFAGLVVLVLLFNINHYSLTENSKRATIEDSTQADALLTVSGKQLNVEYSSKFSFAKDMKKLIDKANSNLESGNDAPAEDQSATAKIDSTGNNDDESDTAASDEKDSIEGNAGLPSNINQDSVDTAETDTATSEENSTEPIDTDIITMLLKNAVEGPLQQHTASFLWLVIGLFSTGSILFSFAKYLSKPPGTNTEHSKKQSDQYQLLFR